MPRIKLVPKPWMGWAEVGVLSQVDRLRWWFMHHDSIHKIQAQETLSIGNLPGRIWDIKREPYDYKFHPTTTKQFTNQFGATFELTVYTIRRD